MIKNVRVNQLYLLRSKNVELNGIMLSENRTEMPPTRTYRLKSIEPK